ncbi:MAG: hypothetical protein O0X93_00290 [Methanocorpusculum sp.]|nr:hypothetical protein [Methanocorpusculum sp.]MDE2524215.1 hypothetical protein [Methanocorpusculum sp.]
MPVLPVTPVILRSGRVSVTDKRLSGSEAATPTGSVLFIGGAPMKGRAEALPLAYLEQSAPNEKTGVFAIGL